MFFQVVFCTTLGYLKFCVRHASTFSRQYYQQQQWRQFSSLCNSKLRSYVGFVSWIGILNSWNLSKWCPGIWKSLNNSLIARKLRATSCFKTPLVDNGGGNANPGGAGKRAPKEHVTPNDCALWFMQGPFLTIIMINWSTQHKPKCNLLLRNTRMSLMLWRNL